MTWLNKTRKNFKLSFCSLLNLNKYFNYAEIKSQGYNQTYYLKFYKTIILVPQHFNHNYFNDLIFYQV